ncbi:MAG: hypothetical protein KDK39_18545 [Leptospiraceae bacterium]|nr:hypothetical protein [Leptospiraceae bacterium]
MKPLIDSTIVCGQARYRVLVCGVSNSSTLLSENTNCLWYGQVSHHPEVQDLVYIGADRPAESWRFLFVQLKNQLGHSSGDFENSRKAIQTAIPELMQGMTLFKDVLIELARRCLEYGCSLYANGVLLRSEDSIEELTDADRKDSGLAGIPLDKLAGSLDEPTNFVRVYSAGMPPMLLVRDKQVTFPTRSWFPGGLLPDWHPWKQNVELIANDRLLQHAEFDGSRSNMTEMHQNLINADYEQLTVPCLELQVLSQPSG